MPNTTPTMPSMVKNIALVTYFPYTIFMAALRSRCGHYIFVLWFLLSSFFAGLKGAVCSSLEIQDAKMT